MLSIRLASFMDACEAGWLVRLVSFGADLDSSQKNFHIGLMLH